MTAPMMAPAQIIEFEVPGVCCVECSQTVATSLRRTPGVSDLRILGTAEKVLVTYDAATTTPEALAQVIRQAGHAVPHWRSRTDTTVSSNERTAEHIHQAHARRARGFAVLRLGLVGFVAVIALAEIAGESLGLLHGVEEIIPQPVALLAVAIGGFPIFWGAYTGLRQRRINTDLVMSLGILAGAAIREFISAALVVFFVTIAHSLEGATTGRSRQAVHDLVQLMPQMAFVKREIGEEEVPLSAVQVDEVVVVRQGERIPIDGTVVVGQATVNQAPITGESLPVDKAPGDDVFAGTINEGGYLEIRVERVGEATTLGHIVQLVEDAESRKAPIQRFADRFSTAFLPAVLTVAGVTLLVSHHLVAAIAVLVAACPCAVGLATPLSVVAAVGNGAGRGLLIKGGLFLETLAKVNTLVIDKTGTLTVGQPRVTDVLSFGALSADDILALAAGLESYAQHPLARAVVEEASQRTLTPSPVEGVEVLPSRGVIGQRGERAFMVGAQRLLNERGVAIPGAVERQASALETQGKTVLLLAERDGLHDTVLGVVALADTVRPEAAEALAQVRRLGIGRILLLTGDNAQTAAAVAQQVGITEVRAHLLPEDKLRIVQELQAEGRRVAMVGDGVNDAPALTQADVGIAMGVAGTDVAVEAADVVLMRDDWHLVPEALRLGRRTYIVIRQNIYFGIAFTVLVIGSAAFGWIGPVIAAATQAVPDVAVALNAARLLHTRPVRSIR